MKKAVAGTILGAAAFTAAISFFGLKASQRIRAHTMIGTVHVGDMPAADAAIALDKWWKDAVSRSINLKSSLLTDSGTVTPADLGIGFDKEATMDLAPRASILDAFRKVPATHVKPVLTLNAEQLAGLKKELESHLKSPSRAKVFFASGKIVREPETGNAEVNLPGLQNALLLAILHESNLEVPFLVGLKRVPDADLASITEIESEFTTKFPTSKKTRCSNIRLASSKLDGIVLLPGEQVSFNGTVGRRTQEAGFQIAGVYKNGKHDVDVGGGICQVSSTFYNAALLANLKIVERHNHSMPVPYVPLGRDATVDYGSLDLEIENNTDHAIAIDSEYHPGKLTFRILGRKNRELDVKIESDSRSRWSVGTQTIVDPTLAPGKTKVIDKGASGEQINTYRLVYSNGKLVRKEPLGRSHYRGGQRIIAVGAAPRATTGDIRLVSSNSN
jgi:vancomycin resistance protein YoaR